MLKDVTRILATHSIAYLKEADLVVVMKGQSFYFDNLKVDF